MKRWNLLPIVFGIMILFSLTNVSAEPLKDNLGDSLTDNNINNIGDTHNHHAYIFNATNSYQVSVVQIYVSEKNGDTGNINVSVMYAGSDGVPNGTVIDNSFSSTIAASSMSAGNYYNFTFAEPPILTVDEPYALVFSTSTPTGGTNIRLGETNGAGQTIWYYSPTEINGTYTPLNDVLTANIKIFGNATDDITVTLNSPSTGSALINASTIFNSTMTRESGEILDLRNATLNIWYANGTLFNESFATITNTTNNVGFNISNLVIGSYKWNVFGCAENSSSVDCEYAPSNFTFDYGVGDISTSFVTPLAETEGGVFNISFNVSSGTPTANLWWNGTSYAGTATSLGSNNWRFGRSLTIPTGNGTKNLFWEINNGALNHNTSVENQDISLLNISLCGAPNGGSPFINFTFKDEGDSSSMGAFVDSSTWDFWLGDGSVTKTVTYSSPTTSTNSYAFCGVPEDKIITTDLTFKYSNTSYPQRTYTLNDQALTNTTTNQVLYLLSTDDGIYSSIQTITSANNLITGVDITIERKINDLWTVIGQATTGDDGLTTFWVNPNFEHRITGSKSGYGTTQVTITPSQSLYSLIMSRGASNSSFNGSLEGMKWLIYPNGGLVDTGTVKFGINLTASLANLDGSYCKMELIRSDTDAILSSITGGTSSSCNLSISYNIPSDIRIFGRFYVDTIDSSDFILIDADARWYDSETNVSTWRNIGSFFEELRDLPEFGAGIRGEYSSYIFFFVIFAILITVFASFTGYDQSYPGTLIIVVWLGILVASYGGYFTTDFGPNGYTFFEKYWVAMITFFITGGYLMSYWSRGN